MFTKITDKYKLTKINISKIFILVLTQFYFDNNTFT